MSEQYEIIHKVESEDIPNETPTAVSPVEENRPVTRRYNKNGNRRGKFAYAAPVGFAVMLLSLVGVVAIVLGLIGYIQKKNDDTALRRELYYYLEPLLIYSPAPFGDAATEEQDAFLNAAAYRVMLAENVRMLREGAEYPQYPVDENYRIAVPVEEIEAAYAALFGAEATLSHRTIEGSGVEYSEGDSCYYIPFIEVSIGYEIVIDTVKQRRNSYEVQVGFVPVTDIQYDEYGEPMAPTADQATHFQVYTLTRDKSNNSYYIHSCEDK